MMHLKPSRLDVNPCKLNKIPQQRKNSTTITTRFEEKNPHQYQAEKGVKQGHQPRGESSHSIKLWMSLVSG